MSYDNPTVAQVAIKAMDGCQVGNKKLKVEHKKVKNRDSTNSSSSSNSSSTSASLSSSRSPSDHHRSINGSVGGLSSEGTNTMMDTSKYHHHNHSSINNHNSTDLSFISTGSDSDMTQMMTKDLSPQGGLKGASGLTEDSTTSPYFSSPFFLNTPNFGLLSSGGKTGSDKQATSYEDLLWRS